jgi:heparan-alpha-glucosaminide N-acetyltransferase
MATQARAIPESANALPATGAKRYLALDAYRGFIMLVLVSGGFGLRALGRRDPSFAWIAGQFDHRPWEWIAFWDLIQPAFMFMVGVAMPFALLFGGHRVRPSDNFSNTWPSAVCDSSL